MADSTPSQYTIMTNAALVLIKQLVDSKNRIKSFRAVASDANHFTDDQEAIAEMTAIDSVKQDGVIQDIQDDGDAKSYIQIDFDQSKIDTAYQLQTVGLFATDEKGKEILYAVECLEHPQYMDVSQTMDMNSHFIHIVVGNTQQLDVSLTPAGTVSVAQLESKLADYVKTDDVKSLIPATVIDGSKPADFKESVTLEKGAVDGEGNAIATTEDVSDGDAATLKLAKEYADAENKSKLSIDDQLGGTNLLLNGKFDNDMSHWNSWGDSVGGTVDFRVGDKDWDNRATNLLHVKKTATKGYLGVSQGSVSVAPHTQYTLSAYRTGLGPIFLQAGSGDSDAYKHTTVKEGAGEVTFTFTTGETRTTNVYVGIGDGDTGELFISLTKLERGATHSDWSPAPEDKADASEVAPLTVGAIHDGADMDKEFTPGSYFSKDAVIHGPGFPNGDVMLTWDVSAVTSNADEATAYTQIVHDQPGDTAVRNFVSGAGWGPWITMADSAKVMARDPNTGVVSEPVDFTKLTVNGGKSVATRDDLKSLEASAWHRLDFGSDANLGGAVLSSYIIYQIHDDEKYLSFFYLGVGQSENTAFSDNTTLMDLSSIVKGISSIDFSTRYTDISNNSGQAADFKISGTKIITSTSNHSIYVNPRSTVSLYPLNHDDRRVYYTELI